MSRATGWATNSIGLSLPIHIQNLLHPGILMDHLAKTIAITTHARMENCHVIQFNIDGRINAAERTTMITATPRCILEVRPYRTPITKTVVHPVTLCRIQVIVSDYGGVTSCSATDSTTHAHSHHFGFRYIIKA